MSKKIRIKITPEIVKHVSGLARLSLDKKELKKMQKDMADIMVIFKDLDRIDVKKIAPSFHPLAVRDIFREDVVKEPLSQEKTLMNTKHKENGYFKGPGAV
ncbi:MAG: Asp-tRNA(Asn)/Glu-tRNA(Gln) amidotransferase subunit GatC [Candidatus Aenigmarchaeota archaeon]|nr:Asp-tRNA(Asn)/Glu-tRNA(Gln) amidotransferase subunit GatC [Candidatus Aenigmarchaeota archaeon]